VAEERFIWCHNCNQVHHVTAHDQAPWYALNQETDEGLTVDDWRAFMSQHTGHRLEALHSCDPVLWQGGGPDPVQERYVEVTNGRDWFVVRGFRASIDESLRFEVARGRLRTTTVAIEIQAKAIRLEMKKHFFWGSTRPSDDKIDRFIKLFKEYVSGLRPEEVRFSQYDCADGAVVYAGLDDGFVETLLHQCAPDFLPEEFLRLRSFVDRHKTSDGVMALRVKRQYTVEPAVGLAITENSK
jgi:hypothetical protein